jgi:hypothetical protein
MRTRCFASSGNRSARVYVRSRLAVLMGVTSVKSTTQFVRKCFARDGQRWLKGKDTVGCQHVAGPVTRLQPR